ncbi:hypothetical protein [Methanobacterium petrolearium]|uniref:hypothetical protein n=1 Tax=Methanobacterium petrolearium TaxID=710190 RepID=UPI001AE203A9|nr:hypothetical protein [Methanobacterium petrolearium]MBP1945578.1 hypothetical protein [Methanobacterium petrolearium]BDZ71796.1 hypothetical protein GCM10025861_23130 [Methanobacterium petrolearium]
MVLNGKKSSKTVIIENGYLFCNHCGGHYKLKNSESHRDFAKCECGNPLEFCKTRKELDQKISNLNQNKKALDQFQARILERRENLLNIFPKVQMDDDFIENTQKEESLWDILDNNLLGNESNKKNDSDVSRKKEYFNVVLEEERLMSNIAKKRASVKNQTFIDRIFSFYNQTDPTFLLSVIIIILLAILSIAVINSYFI